MKLFRQTYGQGPPLVIIHGLLGAGGNWASLARNRFGKHFTTYVLDLRNHGRSPHAERFDYPSMVGDLLEFFDHEKLTHAHVLGHSMGGKLGMHLALEHEEVVDRLIVADIAPRAYHYRHESVFRALDSVDPALFESRQEIDHVLQTSIPDDSLRQFLMGNLVRQDGEFGWRLNLSAIQAGYVNIVGSVESWSTFDGQALFLRGTESDYLDESDLPSIRVLFPFAQIASMQGAGHWLHADKPNLFADLVLEFLSAS